MRVEALTALSKLTWEPCLRLPRFVRRRVSGAHPTLKYHDDSSPLLLNSVMVRQVPFTEIESPRIASPRIVEQEEMVREVPPPPEDVESREFSSVTAVCEVLEDTLSRAWLTRAHFQVHSAGSCSIEQAMVARIWK